MVNKIVAKNKMPLPDERFGAPAGGNAEWSFCLTCMRNIRQICLRK